MKETINHLDRITFTARQEKLEFKPRSLDEGLAEQQLVQIGQVQELLHHLEEQKNTDMYKLSWEPKFDIDSFSENMNSLLTAINSKESNMLAWEEQMKKILDEAATWLLIIVQSHNEQISSNILKNVIAATILLIQNYPSAIKQDEKLTKIIHKLASLFCQMAVCISFDWDMWNDEHAELLRRYRSAVNWFSGYVNFVFSGTSF